MFEAAEVTKAREPAQQGDAGGGSKQQRYRSPGTGPVVTSARHQTTAKLTCEVYTAATALHLGK